MTPEWILILTVWSALQMFLLYWTVSAILALNLNLTITISLVQSLDDAYAASFGKQLYLQK